MSSYSTRSVRHRLLAIIATAALLVAGGAPAQASTPLVVDGTVSFPPGYDPEAALQPSMVLYPVGSSARASTARISPDGTFSGRINSPAAGGYQLALDDYSEELREGWLKTDGTITADRSEARVFTSSASVTVHPTLTSTIRGTVVIPPGVTVDPTRLRIYAETWTGTHWTRAGGAGGAGVKPDYTFTVFGLDTGTDYRLGLNDQDDVLVRQYVGVGGTGVDSVDEAADIPAGATGVTIRPTATLPVAGRATLPSGFDYSSTPSHERTVVGLWEREPGSDRWHEKYIDAQVANDGSFRMVGARSDREYRLRVYSNHRQYENGWLGPDGELVESQRQARVVLGGETNIRFPLRLHTRFTGTVELPPGFRYDPADPPTVSPQSLTYNNYENEYYWGTRSEATVAADGSFTTEHTHSQTDFRLLLTWPDGTSVYWTSDLTAPVSDAARASTTKPRSGVVFPLTSSIVSRTVPTISGKVAFGSTLRATGGSWSSPPARSTYQWLRAGSPIKGANKSAYKVQKADIGKRLSVQVTATAPSFTPGVATSRATAVVPKVTAKVTPHVTKSTTRSKIKLKVRVRTSGAVAKPTGSLRVTYGKKTRTVTMSTKHRGKRTFTIPRSKATGTITVRFTPTKTTARYVKAAKAKTKAKKLVPKVTVKTKKTISRSARAKLTVRVKTPLTSKPTGKVKVTYGKKTRTVALKARDKGKTTVRLPRLGKGKHKVRVRFTPAKKYKSYLKAKNSKRVTIRVR